jgi:hypothetical protein
MAFISDTHPTSRRRAVFESTDAAGYLYLSSPDGHTIVADAWVCNTIDAPPPAQIRTYRPGPPPAARGYATPDALMRDPDAHQWSFFWSADGHSVAICADGVPLAFIRAAQRPGYSRHLARSGPWGEPWSDGIFAAVFASVSD